MVFSRKFARDVKGSPYPVWEEIILTEEEEQRVFDKVRNENKELMKECLKDAEEIMKEEKMKDFQTNKVEIAIALFEKLASHVVYHKEESAKDKFSKKFLEKK